ncbi:iron-sulfur cluster co-chaperone HscB C-terminal domain-containing protein [Hymenobacter koreensis]|uniref:Co-chaperone HscB n=1 Tax=Hymenobacter koreensis TaxID=1084523 RepID=A0ABP8IZE1_9BACT
MSADYFAFYDLPESFLPDEKALKAKYYSLSRQYHPDFHATAEPEEQERMLDLSTQNTNAYRTLSNFDLRLQYILQRHGLLEEGKQDLPNDFLMEVMELNEQLMELEFETDPAIASTVQSEVERLENELEAEARPVLTSYVDLPEEQRPAALLQVRTYYLKRRYLLRIRESLSKFATRS